jgi:hypothetical protein
MGNTKLNYKLLQKNLKDIFVRQNHSTYSVVGGVVDWLQQCGLEANYKQLKIVYNINGSIPYPYQQSDRKLVLDYLKNTKYKKYKKSFK